MTTDLDHAADQLILAAERMAQGHDAVICEAMVHPAWTLEEKELLLTDLVEAVHDLNSYLNEPDYHEHEHQALAAAVDSALWPLLHGLPGERRCVGCTRRGRPAAYSQPKGPRFGVCSLCENEGAEHLYRVIKQAVAR